MDVLLNKEEGKRELSFIKNGAEKGNY